MKEFDFTLNSSTSSRVFLSDESEDSPYYKNKDQVEDYSMTIARRNRLPTRLSGCVEEVRPLLL
jgi:hypothetical protein